MERGAKSVPQKVCAAECKLLQPTKNTRVCIYIYVLCQYIYIMSIYIYIHLSIYLSIYINNTLNYYLGTLGLHFRPQTPGLK